MASVVTAMSGAGALAGKLHGQVIILTITPLASSPPRPQQLRPL
jgi:hypothetical protein